LLRNKSGTRRRGISVEKQALPPNFFPAHEDFWLLWRPVTSVALLHAVHHSTPPRSGLNFRHDVSSRRAASGFANSVTFPPDKGVAGKTATDDEEKRILALVKAGESNAGADHFTDSCCWQTEETKKRKCRYPRGRTGRDSDAARPARRHCPTDSAHDRRQGIRYPGAGRRSWTGLGEHQNACLPFPEVALVRHYQGRQIHERRRSESGWESAGQN
jgi:hypothetical protein